jgi:hypothetical protein
VKKSVVFLIGNGFDIGLGLKTRFQQFLESEGIQKHIAAQPEDSLWARLGGAMKGEDPSWADFELYLGKTVSTWTDDMEALCEFMSEFKEKFVKYLLGQCKENPLDYGNAKELMASWHEKLGLGQDFATADLRFINFNYTDTLRDFLIKAFGHADDMIHIHGQIGDAMIMIGVDDDSQIKNENLLTDELLNEIIKKTLRDEKKIGDKSVWEIAEEWISEADAFVVFGMELGETDKQFWQLIAPYVRERGSKKIYIVNVSSSEDSDNKRKDCFKDKLIGNLKSPLDWSGSTAVRRLKNKISVFLDTGMFDVKKGVPGVPPARGVKGIQNERPTERPAYPTATKPAYPTAPEADVVSTAENPPNIAFDLRDMREFHHPAGCRTASLAVKPSGSKTSTSVVVDYVGDNLPEYAGAYLILHNQTWKEHYIAGGHLKFDIKCDGDFAGTILLEPKAGLNKDVINRHPIDLTSNILSFDIPLSEIAEGASKWDMMRELVFLFNSTLFKGKAKIEISNLALEVA